MMGWGLKIVPLALAMAGSLALSGCSSLPYSGPTSHAIVSQAAEHVGGNASPSVKAPQFVLVDLNGDTINTLLAYRSPIDSGKFTRQSAPADIRVGIGDVISITIFESDSGGLFTPASTSSQGNYVRIPDQEVDRTGTVKVPFLGSLKVSDRRPSEIEADIESALRDRAIEPQAVVTIVNRNSARYTVVGEVNKPGVFVMSQDGERILDAIGEASGAKYTPQETLVTLQSGSRETTVRLSAITENSANNIYLRPGDTLSITHDRRAYTVFGAATESGQVVMEKDDLTLADALAQVGGLVDGAADASSVVVYRFMPRATLTALGASLKDFPPDQSVIPVVLRLDLHAGGGYFLAQSVYVESGDVIYISNASLYDFTKLTAIVRDINGTVVSGRSAYNAVR